MNFRLLYRKKLIFILIFMTCLQGCFKWTDARKVSPNPDERIKKNMEEGKGLRVAGIGKGNTSFQFASSNPLWRSTLDILEFAPLINANYSGGIIITDWVSTEDASRNEFFKITVKFLSNEIRPDGIDITLHQKVCQKNNVCKISKLDSAVAQDLRLKILKRAALYAKDDTEKLKEELGEYRVIPIK